ncbi:DNA-processing protein DprA [Weissella thailandensis]|uniref:DNA-processing protein DprA n=1 Tax=Weissella thailandensis TaxID=89061 RepID=UPI0027E47DB8|nr:DNA-processing protein DprA [Weissella thailandensis]
MAQRDFLLWLLMVPGLSIKGRYRIWIYLRDNKLLKLPWQQILIISKMRQPQRDAATFWFKQTKWQTDWQRLRKQTFIAICDEEYPIYLYECIDAPICLFYKGDLSLLSQPSVAIVGSRQATKYGQGILSSWIPDLVSAGLVTVSGLAAGIDELTHRETLKAKGKTIAVIGTGLNQIYPKRCEQLQSIISHEGLLLSEYLPWQGPKRQHFPARNRIISGLSQVCLVIEAKKRSGSLITAMLALDQNRTVMALPGRVDVPTSRGTNELILAGAIPVLSVEQIILEFANFY